MGPKPGTKRKIDYNPYELLALQPGCSDNEIDKAYKKAALKWHPDKNPSKNAQEMFIKVFQAYEFLKDKIARLEYDETESAKRRRFEYEEVRKATSTVKRRELIEKLNAKEKAAATPSTSSKKTSHGLNDMFEKKHKNRDSTIEQLSRQAAEMMEEKLRQKWKEQGIDSKDDDVTIIGEHTGPSKDTTPSTFNMSAEEFDRFEAEVLGGL
ncbi:dnaJ domain-containing protein [Ditylenchus destructor]|nr:dnaJ domain-containing protein [Ditylenchus destructor]